MGGAFLTAPVPGTVPVAAGAARLRHQQQGQAQAADLAQHPVQRRLVHHGTRQQRFAAAARRHHKALEPVRPARVQVALHPDVVDALLGRRAFMNHFASSRFTVWRRLEIAAVLGARI